MTRFGRYALAGLASALLVITNSAAAFAATPSELRPDRGCIVALGEVLQVGGGIQRVQVTARADENCRIQIERSSVPRVASSSGRYLARPLSASTHSCFAENVTWRADGEWVTLLTTSVGFGYDGSNVFNVSSSHQDAAQNGYQEGSGPYWQDPRTQGYSLPNSWWWVRYYNATYYFWGFYDHEKNNKVWEYYNGTCSFEGQHYGYVPRGGYVQLTLTQW